MTGSIDLLQAAAEQFVIRLLPTDKGMVGAFNDKIQFTTGDFTSSRDELVGALKDIDYGNPTRLWDATEASIDQLKRVTGRRVVLVFTDGDDTSSKIGLGKIMEEARASEVMVYSIGLQSVFFNGQRQVRTQPDKGLRKISDETGGGYFELRRTDDLGSDVHARGAGAAQPVRARLRAGHRRQAAQARGAREAAGHDGARAQDLPGADRRHAVTIRSGLGGLTGCSCIAMHEQSS